MSTDLPLGKPSYLSKTIWANIIMACLPLWPEASAFFTANPWFQETLFLTVNVILRAATKDKLTIV